ncbi:hypothetical protein MCO_01606 [Bartonella sp. DB5-6]|uniref:hypothetical protein n=1 Tax=Bartonella sp. DB5-6 TaxID=1094755 RepID=UPI00026E960D|nr:hypothetical protein [Bartonella sp. DB5-6]EJF76539.1 hypothetical protein MCO_01606 [Bartonella sp. DB5-6]
MTQYFDETLELKVFLTKISERIKQGHAQITREEEKKALKACQKLKETIAVKSSLNNISKAFSLLEGGLIMRQMANVDACARAYAVALQGISRWALCKAVEQIVRGEAKGMSTTFVPTSADLAAYCRGLEEDLCSDVDFVLTALNT